MKLIACIMMTLLLSSCGQAGGLYLPKNPPPPTDDSQQTGS